MLSEKVGRSRTPFYIVIIYYISQVKNHLSKDFFSRQIEKYITRSSTVDTRLVVYSVTFPSLACLVEAYGRLADVKEEEGLGLVSDVCLEIAPDDHVPSGAVFTVEELLDVLGLLLLGDMGVDGDGGDGL
jgi:hypothetical protein